MGLDPGLGVEGREGREVCGVATTMLGRHWNSRHPSPPNSRHGLLALRNRVAWRYLGHRGGATPPPAEFGGGKRRLFTATPLRAGYYGSVQLTLGR